MLISNDTNENPEGWAVVQKSITGSEFIMTGFIVSPPSDMSEIDN